MELNEQELTHSAQILLHGYSLASCVCRASICSIS